MIYLVSVLVSILADWLVSDVLGFGFILGMMASTAAFGFSVYYLKQHFGEE